MRRDHVASTLMRRHFDAVCLLGGNGIWLGIYHTGFMWIWLTLDHVIRSKTYQKQLIPSDHVSNSHIQFSFNTGKMFFFFLFMHFTRNLNCPGWSGISILQSPSGMAFNWNVQRHLNCTGSSRISILQSPSGMAFNWNVQRHLNCTGSSRISILQSPSGMAF